MVTMVIIGCCLTASLIAIVTLMITYRKMWIRARSVNTELIIRMTEKCGADASRDIMFKKKEDARRELPKNAWVSVDERMPKNLDVVLINNPYIQVALYREHLGFVPITHVKQHGVKYKEETQRMYSGVTHWMPIPIIPEDSFTFEKGFKEEKQ